MYEDYYNLGPRSYVHLVDCIGTTYSITCEEGDGKLVLGEGWWDFLAAIRASPGDNPVFDFSGQNGASIRLYHGGEITYDYLLIEQPTAG